MKNNLRILVSLGALALAMNSGAPAAADLANAQKIVNEVCQACHGKDGNSPIPENPKLAGQHPDYLAKALRDYKSGARKNAVMGAMVANYKDKDFADLAAYFAAQPPVLVSRY